MAVGTTAVGATAIGTLAFGAVAIGALAIRRLAVKQARVQHFEIDELVVNRFVVREAKGGAVSGVTDQPDLFERSPLRNGNGAHPHRAHRTGSSLRPGDDAPAGTPGTAENICPDCGGSGLDDGTTCMNCDGTGRVVEGLAGG